MTLCGLPRFKQIINAIDNADTANMRIMLTDEAIGSEKAAQCFASRSFAATLARVHLADIVQRSWVQKTSM